ncbi:GTP cyclohydrolase II [Saccharopolyspora spinosporotrichia]|uniref:GTP cyclohydrolase II n=1 Tax=Saccharopolyspora erythraea TaxID=1836 RepID=A0ABN1DCW5_SACER
MEHMPSPLDGDQRPPAAAEDGGDSPVVVRRRVTIPLLSKAGGATLNPEVVTFSGSSDGQEHIALVFGGGTEVPLVRVHSECLTGDVFGSARCDCGPQLDEAIETVSRQGGVILYLRQEGRGIGLYNKLDAYFLQDELGVDTFEANRRLNFSDDERDYRVAAAMLRALGIDRIRILSNNPDKVEQLTGCGIDVAEAVPTGVFVNDANRKYLMAKVTTAGHQVELMEGAL